MSTLMQDVKYALRMLGKAPGFAAIAILTLALGIGANTALFSLTDQVLLRSLPVPDPQQLVIVRSPGLDPGHSSIDTDNGAQSFSYPLYKDIRERSTVFSGLFACFAVDVNVSGHGSTQSAAAELVSGNYFETLEVTPALGRVFMASDETAEGANPVAVLSYPYWVRQFGADPSILNQPLTVNGIPLTVVGVARQGFDGVQIGAAPDLFVPFTMTAQMDPGARLSITDRTDHWVAILGRLKPGMAIPRAEAELQPIYAPLLEEDAKLHKMSGDELKRFLAKPLLLIDGSHGRLILQADAEKPLLLLVSMVGLVLLIACANLASLLLARGEARQREIAVRLALGAGRGRVVQQLLTESLLIGIAGGAAGIVLASWCLGAMVSAIPAGLVSGLNAEVLWFALGVTVGTTVLFGLAPAMRATRVNLQTTLKDQGSSVSEGRSNVRLRKVLIVSQVALTALMLAGAGLLARTLINLEHASLGVNPEHVLQFSVEPELNGYTIDRTAALGDGARREIGALPGVRSVAYSGVGMFTNNDVGFNITPEGYTAGPGEEMDVLADSISPDFFSATGTPLIAGREFTDADAATSPKVVIINETLARKYFAGRNPIGMRIERGGGKGTIPDREIVGVVADAKWDSPRSSIQPFVYMPYTQDVDSSELTFYVRTERDPEQLAAAVRRVMERLDANLPVNNLRTLAAQADESMSKDRVVAELSISLAALAAMLAVLGLYGVLAYVVARRAREIGIRMALGAQRSNVLGIVLGQGAMLTLVGGAIGIAAALALTHLASSLLYGVSAQDPLTFAGVAVLLALVAGTACYLPARRATKVDPMQALRYE